MLPVSVVLVGSAASVLSLYSVVPQLLRAVRSRAVDGVSWSSILLSMATFTLWCVYACSVADAIQVVNNGAALVLLLALALAALRAGVPSRSWSPLAVIFATGAGALLLVDVANSLTLAMVGTAVSSVRMLPQTRLALSKAPLWGLCPWSTLLAWWGTGLWLVYALMAGDYALALASLVMGSMQTVIVTHRLPLRRTLASLAGGRLGHPVATLVMPLSQRLPERREDYDLAA